MVQLNWLESWKSRKKTFTIKTEEKKIPTVSVTVCSFNHEKYIRECAESVLAQTYSPLEIIFSDDGSSDRTAEIIKACLDAYKGNHSVTFLRHSKNLGGKGRENFLESYRHSTGQFVIQFCGDDVMVPTMVEKMVETWLVKKVSMVTVNAEYIDHESRLLGRLFRDPNRKPECSLEAIARDGVNDAVFGAGMGCSRELLEYFEYDKNGVPEHLGASDIILTFYACLLNGCEVIGTPLMKYRYHGEQGSSSIALEMAESELQKLVYEERIWLGHLTHARLMQEKLDKYVLTNPKQFKKIKKRIHSLLEQQTVTMANRLVNVRKQLFYKYKITEINPPTRNISPQEVPLPKS